jgi:hypothetical protein
MVEFMSESLQVIEEYKICKYSTREPFMNQNKEGKPKGEKTYARMLNVAQLLTL